VPRISLLACLRPPVVNQIGPNCNDPAATSPALPPARSHPACDPNCVDVKGKAPEGVRIDPEITEGHPGYEKSGGSEIIPMERLMQGTSPRKEESR
jgi:hypothetical protein